jgi:hypothetical protein
MKYKVELRISDWLFVWAIYLYLLKKIKIEGLLSKNKYAFHLLFEDTKQLCILNLRSSMLLKVKLDHQTGIW